MGVSRKNKGEISCVPGYLDLYNKIIYKKWVNSMNNENVSAFLPVFKVRKIPGNA